MAVPEVGGSYQNPFPSTVSAAAPVENPSPAGGVVSPQTHQPATEMTATKAPAGLTAWPGPGGAGMPAKKKRGRPRKYAPDGSAMVPLNPTPISASPPAGQRSAPPAFSLKRIRGRPGGFLSKQQPRIELESLGNHFHHKFILFVSIYRTVFFSKISDHFLGVSWEPFWSMSTFVLSPVFRARTFPCLYFFSNHLR